MRSLTLFFLFLLAALFPLKAAHTISEERYSDGSKMTLIAQVGILPSGGFFPVRVEMDNQGLSEESWKIRCASEVYSRRYLGGSSSDEDRISSTFTVTCPSKSNRTVDLLIPIHQRILPYSGESRMGFTITKGEESRYRSFEGNSTGDSHVGMSMKVLNRFESELESAWASRRVSGGYSRYSASNFMGPIDVKKLPNDWRAYAGYDAFVLSRDDYLALEPGPKKAIEQWVLGGGHLVVLKDGINVPLPAFEKAPLTQGFGLKTVLECGANYDDFDANKLKSILSLAPISLTSRATKNYNTSLWDVGNELGSRSLGTTFILLALVIFAIIVGPVNLFFWANKNHRQRLIWTTPLISLIASVLMVAFIMLKDGFGGDGVRAVAIDVGGPDDNTAVIIQEQFSRTGILLDSDFSFDKNTVFTAVPAPETDFNRGGSSASYGVFSAEIQPSDEGWSVEGNFFQSRAERAQVLRSVIPSRERLELLPNTQEAPRLVSSFSYPLTDIFYHDSQDQIWVASAIEPGATVTMTRSTATERDSRLTPTVVRFGKGHRGRLEAAMIRPGCFAALSEKAPALESQTSIDWKSSPALITGRLIK